MNEKETKTNSLDGKEPLPNIEQSQTTEKSLDEKINDVFGPLLKTEQVVTAVAIARDPKTGDLAIMYRGHFYDAAKLLSDVLGRFREKIESELS
jgi:hypothetical protein